MIGWNSMLQKSPSFLKINSEFEIFNIPFKLLASRNDYNKKKIVEISSRKIQTPLKLGKQKKPEIVAQVLSHLPQDRS